MNDRCSQIRRPVREPRSVFPKLFAVFEICIGRRRNEVTRLTSLQCTRYRRCTGRRLTLNLVVGELKPDRVGGDSVATTTTMRLRPAAITRSSSHQFGRAPVSMAAGGRTRGGSSGITASTRKQPLSPSLSEPVGLLSPGN